MKKTKYIIRNFELLLLLYTWEYNIQANYWNFSSFWPWIIFGNILLYCYEDRWIRQLTKPGIRCARRSSCNFQFLGILTAINNGGEFKRRCKEICPPDLEFKYQSIYYSGWIFFEFGIKIEHEIFNIQLYDKRDASHFH